MAYEWVTWLAEVLRDGGVSVVEYPGWTTRGQDDGGFEPRALIFHHDASAAGPTPSEPAYLADLSHPGAQCWVAMDGTWHLIAAGRMWHAGTGQGWGVIPADQGNTYSIGVETDHTTGETWPSAQLDSIRLGMAAICKARRWDPAQAIAGHKEFAPGRKDDPDGVDLDAFRRDVADLITHPTTPDVRDEDDVKLYRDEAGAVFAGAPGVWYRVPNTEYETVLAGAGGLGEPGTVNARQRDVLRSAYLTMRPAPALDPAAFAEALAPHLPQVTAAQLVDALGAAHLVATTTVSVEPTP